MTKALWATFASSLPETDAENPEPKGWLVVSRLVTLLRLAGLAAEEPDNWRDSGYSSNCTVNGRQVYFFVSHVGKGAAQWALCCTADASWLQWFARRESGDEQRILANLINRALQASNEFSDVRWYSTGWFGQGDEPWTSEP
jgi:hypothetical protein